MRDQIIKELVTLLQDNVGQRITVALATGIATHLNGAIAQLEAAQAEDFAPSSPGVSE